MQDVLDCSVFTAKALGKDIIEHQVLDQTICSAPTIIRGQIRGGI